MKMSKFERLILANQYHILSIIDPSNKDSYMRAQDAVESGYESAIQNLFDPISEGLDIEGCRFVNRVMDMYAALQRSFDKLKERSGISPNAVLFDGFDGNTETELMSYARFIVEQERRYTHLKPEMNDFNCHAPSAHRYQNMLEAWEAMPDKFNLSAEAIQAVLNAR